MIDRSRGILPTIHDLIIDDEPTRLNFYATRFAIIAIGGIVAIWIWTL